MEIRQDPVTGKARDILDRFNGINQVADPVAGFISRVCRGGRVESTTEAGRATNQLLAALSGAKPAKTRSQEERIPTAGKRGPTTEGTPGQERTDKFADGVIAAKRPRKNTLVRKAERSLMDGVPSLERFLGVEQPSL
jgi:hypothetical protein